jgi:hypothetical protein
MFTVLRRAWVIARWHGIRITPFPLAVLNADFTATEITDYILRAILSFFLSGVNAAGPVRASFLHGPTIGVFNNVTIIC